MNTPVNFQISKLLKEKGFNLYCTYSYWEEILTDMTPGYALEDGTTSQENYWDFDRYYAPTIAEIIMWLYEKHGIFVTVNIPYEEFGKFSAEIWGKNLDDGIKILLADGMSMFDSIEKAYEEGIEHCLVNLI